MKKRRILIALVAATVLVGLLAVLDARIKVDGRDPEYNCTNATDPYCSCLSIIGDESWCSGFKDDPNEGTSNWGTDCSGDLCKAFINCTDGSRETCEGEYRAQADEEGVRCQDTWSDPGDSAYCPD